MLYRLLVSALSLIILITFTPGVRAAEEVLDGVAAVVNDEVITFSQVRELILAREHHLRQTLQGAELAKQVKELRMGAINELIDRAIVLQEFKKSKFNIPEYILDDHINTIIREQFGGDRQAFIRTLQAQNYTIQRFRKLETDKMIVQAMRQRAVKTNPIISPAKLERYYQKHIGDFSTPSEVKLRMIILRSENPNAGKIAHDMRSRIRTGAEFARMASLYSEDSTRESGGDWGWIGPDTLHEALAGPAFSLRAGEISPVIEIGGNYYLLYVEARKAGKAKPLSEVRDEVIRRMQFEERQAEQEKWIAGLRKKAYVKIF